MLENIKLLLGIEDDSKDNLLNYLLVTTTRKVINYCRVKELNEELKDLVVELTVIRYNKMGSEGLQSESYSGVSQSWLNDIPIDLKMILDKYTRKIKLL